MAGKIEQPTYSRYTYLRLVPFKFLRHWVQFGVVWCFLMFTRLVPVRVTQRAGALLGRILFPLAQRDRAICEFQLELIYPELDAGERRRLAVDCFRHMGMTLMETLAMPRIRGNPERWVELEGEQVLRDAYGEGRGVILATGHMGNWELLSVAFDQMKIPAQAVVRSLFNPHISNLLVRNRKSEFMKVVERGSRQSPRQLLNCLKQGDVLLVAIDHDTEAPGVFVDFFGIPANTPRVAASLALRLGVPIVTGFDRRRTDGTHQFTFRRIDIPAGLKNDQEGTLRVTQQISDAMEAHIREQPEQWSWNHRRWNRRPEG